MNRVVEAGGIALLSLFLAPKSVNACTDEALGAYREAAGSVFVELEVDRDLRHLVEGILKDVPAKRYRVVRVGGGVIRQAIADVDADPCARLVLPLFDDVTLVSTAHTAINYFDGARAGMSSWLGSVSRSQGSVSLVMRVDGSVSVNAYSDRNWFRIVPVPTHPSAHLIIEIDRAGFKGIRID